MQVYGGAGGSILTIYSYNNPTLLSNIDMSSSETAEV